MKNIIPDFSSFVVFLFYLSVGQKAQFNAHHSPKKTANENGCLKLLSWWCV
jgi:hypothetical protein